AHPQFPAERHQVIVVHPDQVVLVDQRGYGIGETLVHPRITAGKAALELREVEPVVEEGPKRAVRIAIIIFVDILRFQVDGCSGDAEISLEIDMARERLRLLAGPAEPDAVALPQRRGQRDCQAALIAGAIAGWRRDAVGDNDQAAHRTELQGLLSRDAQLIRPTSE